MLGFLALERKMIKLIPSNVEGIVLPSLLVSKIIQELE